MDVSVSRIEFEDLERMMNENDVVGIAKILEGANYRVQAEDEVLILPFSNRREVASMILSYAVMLAEKGELSDEMTEELIIRTSRSINVIDVIRMIQFLEEHVERPEDYEVIPGWVRDILKIDDAEYEPNIENFIAGSPDGVFETILNYFLSGEVKSLDVRYNPMLIRGMWERGLIPKRRVITLMAIFLKDQSGGLENLFRYPLAAAMMFGAPVFP